MKKRKQYLASTGVCIRSPEAAGDIAAKWLGGVETYPAQFGFGTQKNLQLPPMYGSSDLEKLDADFLCISCVT